MRDMRRTAVALVVAALVLLLYSSTLEQQANAIPAAIPRLPPVVSDADDHIFLPLCNVDRDRKLCVRGGQVAFPCGAKRRTAPFNASRTWTTSANAAVQRRLMELGISSTGAWEVSPGYTYYLDLSLTHAIAGIVRNDTATTAPQASVTEFGAGKGCYKHALAREGLLSFAYEGAANIELITYGVVKHLDLTDPNSVGKAVLSDWVICLEVLEHIPPAHEETALRVLDASNRRGLIVSWSSHANGRGHVNARDHEYVVNAFRTRGYVHDITLSDKLKAAATLRWFVKSTTFVVLRRDGLLAAPP
mmetsp:Transcript_24290/g.75713  ORF Transcript_24290/g.75713 Transcript_24290/m.75713 type:complete len:304 (+) Transcript_24290:8-919(+)